MIETAIDKAIAATEPRSITGLPMVAKVSGYMDNRASPATRAGEYLMCSWVPEARLPPARVAQVRGYVESIAHRLDLGEVRVLWFEQSATSHGDFPFPANRTGELPAALVPPVEYGPGLIGINAAISGDSMLEAAVAHECRHLWQRWMRDQLLDEDQCERDAEAFVSAYLSADAA